MFVQHFSVSIKFVKPFAKALFFASTVAMGTLKPDQKIDPLDRPFITVDESPR